MQAACPMGKPSRGHWVGVERGWQAAGANPLDRLVSLPAERLKTHALLIGATGSGKTNLLHHLIAQDVLLRRSFVVLDLRGDLVSAALEICAGRVDPAKVALINLREKVRPTGFDPLHGSGEPYFRALNVLNAVAAESDNWGPQLAEFLRNALMLLAMTGGKLTDIESLFHNRGFLLRCLDACPEGPVADFWRRFDELLEAKRTALASPVTNKVSLLLATDSLRRILGHPNPLDLGRHLDTPGSATLVSLAADETHAAGRMAGKLVLSSVCREIFARVDVPESRRNPVRLYVDEFEHFGMAEFETILAEGRRFGLSLVLAHQTLAQLSPRMRSLILGNVGTKMVFRCGREDAATLSKDLTGDPRALDLTVLPTGEAAMWTRQDGCRFVEINAPIVRDAGGLSDAARRFLRQVQEQAGPAVIVQPPAERNRRDEETRPGAQSALVEPTRTEKRARVVPSEKDVAPRTAEPERQKAKEPVRPKTDLEDWLCG